DPLPSGDDSSILNELMVFCTNLQEHVLDLQEEKAGQAKEIDVLKKKVSKLNKWRKSRSGGLRRLKKFSSVKRVKSPMEKDGLDDETQRRTNDDEMFRVDDLTREVVMDSAADPVTTVKDSAAPTTDITKDEITMAQALATLKSVKPKVVVQEQEMRTTILAAATTVTTVVPTPRAKDKAKMIEPEFPLKKKEHMGIDEQYARKLQAEEQEASRPSRAQQDEEANNSWDNMLAMMDADRLLAERLQAREREEFFEVQKARLLLAERLQAREREEFFEVQKARLEMAKMNNFIAMDSEAQKRSAIEAQESSTKRTAEHLESDISKKQKVPIKATPISSRSPTIIDYKIHKEGKKNYFKIIRADGNSQVYQTFEKMFKNFNREDLEVLCAIVKDRFKKEKAVDDMNNILFRTLKTMFEHYVEATIWKYQQGLAKVYPLTRNTLHQLWSDVRL
nr:hypothetical protein [Tanacetum cinerariifolium]